MTVDTDLVVFKPFYNLDKSKSDLKRQLRNLLQNTCMIVFALSCAALWLKNFLGISKMSHSGNVRDETMALLDTLKKYISSFDTKIV